jgi:hypothetical protein
MLQNASKNTMFGKADDKLSRMISSLLAIYKGQEEAFEDLHAWHAPSECGTMIIRYTKNLKADLFEQEGMTEREFSKAIRTRISNRWIYYNLNIHEEEEE